MTKKKPTLWLLPNLLDAGQDPHLYLPPIVQEKLKELDGLIAESPKEGRRYLKSFTFDRFASVGEVPMQLLNEHTKPDELTDLLKPILEGQKWGLISDAGLPCLADPGAQLVWKARERGIEIETFLRTLLDYHGPSAFWNARTVILFSWLYPKKTRRASAEI